MELSIVNLDTNVLVLALVSGIVAGIVKGVVGFAMPMILMSSLAMLFPIHTALAALILPTVITNYQQAHEQGFSNSVNSLKNHKLFLSVMALFILASAKFTPYIPQQSLMGILGILVLSFSLFHISGIRFEISHDSTRSKIAFATLAGFAGGICGAFGPPTVAYLTALKTEKNEQMQVQAIIYGFGAILMFIGHVLSGIFNLSTAPLSALLILPCIFGFWIGAKVRHRLNQDLFRIATLMVLLFVGANLTRWAWLA